MRTLVLINFLILLPGFTWVAPGKRIQVYAHRGARAFEPENTMPAYRAALHIGADWIDMDVVLTKDNEVLLCHDPVLNPDITRDEHGKFLAPSREALNALPESARREYERKYSVLGLTLEELRRFEVGRLNPASAYSRFFPDQVEPSHPEYSPPPSAFAAAVYKVLSEEGVVDRVEVHAFDFRCLYELQKLDKRIRTAYLTSRDNEKDGVDSFFSPDPKVAGLWTGGKLLKDYGGSIPAMVKALGGFAWDPEDAELTKEALAEAHRLGLKVVVWSWPEKLGSAFNAELTTKMIEWGVDGIITDDPGRLTSMLAARGLPVPDRY
jgi:glycerophosphoryl diester phosphodiesterase